MRLLLFGGTFDPPHIGHMALLAGAIATVSPDLVVVMPAGLPPHKQASATPPVLRLAMCACFKTLFANLEVSELEIRAGGKSYTYDTVLQLEESHPGAEIYLSVGGDMLLSFEKWHRYEELLARVTLVVQDRGEARTGLEAAAGALRAKGGRVIFATGETPLVSSTEIRQGIAAGRDVWALMPPEAREVVRSNRLYLNTEDY